MRSCAYGSPARLPAGRPCGGPLLYSAAKLNFHYLAVEGLIGLGKTVLAEKLAARLDATVVLDDGDNPFLSDFYADRPGAAFQAQLFFTLARHRQLLNLRQRELFSQTTQAPGNAGIT